MVTKKRILFIANEMSPYLELTEFAETVNKLAIKSNENSFEVRCIMPRFGVINERRHRLHEVVRLSGINVSIDNDDYPLQIKVASLPNARLQVYFLENEDLFKRKFIFHDEKDKWFEDNGLRTVFFCKGALETVYKKEPVFAHSKVVFTIGQNTFKEKLGADFLKLANIHPTLKDKDLDPYGEANNTAMFRGGATYADAITLGAEKIDKKLSEEFGKARGKKVLSFNAESDLTDYLQLYTDLCQ
jgi:starch synthase